MMCHLRRRAVAAAEPAGAGGAVHPSDATSFCSFTSVLLRFPFPLLAQSQEVGDKTRKNVDKASAQARPFQSDRKKRAPRMRDRTQQQRRGENEEQKGMTPGPSLSPNFLMQVRDGAEDARDSIKDKASDLGDNIKGAYEDLKEKVTGTVRSGCISSYQQHHRS